VLRAERKKLLNDFKKNTQGFSIENYPMDFANKFLKGRPKWKPL